MMRNKYIDFLRGLAALSIVNIHTTFCSGEAYIPSWFSNLCLLIDVPFFFYLSGWSSSYRESNILRTCKSIANIWLKWIYFVNFLVLFCALSQLGPVPISGITSIKELVSSYMFLPQFTGLSVIGSIWFMPYYIIVIIFNTIILTNIQKSEKAHELKCVYTMLLGMAFLWVCYGLYFFGIDAQIFLFYGFVWMLGYSRVIKVDSPKKFMTIFLCILAGTAFSSYLQGIPLYAMQNAKSPPTLKYLFGSFIVIVIVEYVQKYVKKPCAFLVHIGENAIYYFFAQGIGGSILYYVITYITVKNWVAKWVIMLCINLAITIIFAELLRLSFNYIKCRLVINGMSKEKNI